MGSPITPPWESPQRSFLKSEIFGFVVPHFHLAKKQRVVGKDFSPYHAPAEEPPELPHDFLVGIALRAQFGESVDPSRPVGRVISFHMGDDRSWDFLLANAASDEPDCPLPDLIKSLRQVRRECACPCFAHSSGLDIPSKC